MVMQAYFDQVKALISKYAGTRFVLDAKVSYEMRPGEQGYLPGSLTFADGSTLHFSMGIDGNYGSCYHCS